MNKVLKLSRLETRFLLNFALTENNKLVHPSYTIEHPSTTNLANVKNETDYRKRMNRLVTKLLKADRAAPEADDPLGNLEGR